MVCKIIKSFSNVINDIKSFLNVMSADIRERYYNIQTATFKTEILMKKLKRNIIIKKYSFNLRIV